MKVLVCDDDAASRLAIKGLIERYFRCTVTECANGAEALELLTKDVYAFMFLDLNMPVLDGIEALKQIRAAPATKTLPVVILSGENDSDAIEQVMRLGISDYVLKPPHTHAVISKVERIVKMLPK